jgi:hypothetical protein
MSPPTIQQHRLPPEVPPTRHRLFSAFSLAPDADPTPMPPRARASKSASTAVVRPEETL